MGVLFLAYNFSMMASSCIILYSSSLFCFLLISRFFLSILMLSSLSTSSSKASLDFSHSSVFCCMYASAVARCLVISSISSKSFLFFSSRMTT